MTDCFETGEGVDRPDGTLNYGPTIRPETDLGEGSASRHGTEDLRRTIDPDQDAMWIDPVTGEPTILP